MKIIKLFLALVGAVMWGAFALYMNDMNSASDLDYAEGLVKVALVGVLAFLWLVFWVGFTWFSRQEVRMAWHLTIVIAILWINSLVLEIGLPWLAYLAGWMWPKAMTAGLQALLIGSAVILQIRKYQLQVNNATDLLFLALSFFIGTVIAVYIHTTQLGSIYLLPYQTQIFQSFS